MALLMVAVVLAIGVVFLVKAGIFTSFVIPSTEFQVGEFTIPLLIVAIFLIVLFSLGMGESDTGDDD